jgi:hypothetical protein
MDANKDTAEYNYRKGPVISYEMVATDDLGRSITPYLGVKIDDSPFVPAEYLMQGILNSAALTLKSLADREAG